jgi:hypothetical protein
MAATGYISDKQDLTFLPDGGTDPADTVDLACYVTEPPTDAVTFDTVDTPTLCDPQASQVHVGARELTLVLLWTDDWADVIEPLFGTNGTLKWWPATNANPGYAYEVSWPATYGISAPFGESITVEVTLGVSSRVIEPAA